MEYIVPQEAVPRIIDKRRLQMAKRRARSRLDAYPGSDFLLREISMDLDARLSVVSRRFRKSLIIAPRYDGILDVVHAKTDGNVLTIDEMRMHDELLQIADDDFDLVVSIGQLHLMDDVPGTLLQLRKLLKPDGLLMACVPGAGSISNFRAAWISAEAELTGAAVARFLPLFDVRSAGTLLQNAGFTLPVVDLDEVTVNYSRLASLVDDLRSLASGNVLASDRRFPVKRTVWRQLEGQFAGDQKMPIRFELVWMSGWAPASNQPKPLKPGSAEVSLASVLKRR